LRRDLFDKSAICRYHMRHNGKRTASRGEGIRGEQTLGRALSSDRDMREAIRDGFPPAVVKELMRTSGLTLKELASALDLSPEACSAVVAAEDWRVMNPTGFTDWLAL